MHSLADQAIDAAIKQDWDKAILLNLKLLELKPHHIPTLNRLAKAYKEAGKSTKALNTYSQVIELDPFNSIALKNLKQLKHNQTGSNQKCSYIINFIEEPGRTKSIHLTRLGNQRALSMIQPGQIVDLVIKKHCIAVHNFNEYIGSIPDDISYKLKPIIESGTIFQSAVKSASDKEVIIFIRELKRSDKYRYSFTFNL